MIQACAAVFCGAQGGALEKFEIRAVIGRDNGQNTDRTLPESITIVGNFSVNCG